MEIVFAAKEATLSHIQERMEEAPTRPALRSLLTILEQKGLLTHTKSGREFVFRPVVAPVQAGRSVLRRVLHTFFEGSFSRALSAYLSDPKAKLSAEEIADLSAFIEKARPAASRTKKGTKS